MVFRYQSYSSRALPHSILQARGLLSSPSCHVVNSAALSPSIHDSTCLLPQRGAVSLLGVEARRHGSYVVAPHA